MKCYNINSIDMRFFKKHLGDVYDYKGNQLRLVGIVDMPHYCFVFSSKQKKDMFTLGDDSYGNEKFYIMCRKTHKSLACGI